MTSEQGLARIRGVISRRRLVVATASVATLLVGAAMLLATDRMYRASAVLRVLESQPSHEYVPPTVTEQMGERLKSLRLALMARPLLASVVANLHLAEADHRSADEVLDGMRGRMDVKVEGEDTFLLTYEDRDPERARAVVNQLVERFVAGETRRRQDVTRATEHALQGAVEELRPELERLERSVAAYKAANNGSLPEQQEENLRNLDQTTVEINIQSTNLELQEERRRQLLLGSTSPIRHQEDLLSTALHDALTHYTPWHPEVARVRSELERVHEARIADEAKLHESARANPELVALSSSIDRSRSILSSLRKRQDEVRARVARTAEVGQALVGMATDVDAIKGKYTSALGKLHDVQLASSLEVGLRGLRYHTVEGATLPAHAAHPNKPLLGLGLALLSALVGVGAGFLREGMDTTIREPEELGRLEGVGLAEGSSLDVLACVPRLDDRTT